MDERKLSDKDANKYTIEVENYRGWRIRKTPDDNERYAVFSIAGFLWHYGDSVADCRWWVDGLTQY